MINWSALLVLYHDKVKPLLLVTSQAIPLKLCNPLRGYEDASLGLGTKHAAWNVIPCVLMGSSQHCHYYVPQKSLPVKLLVPRTRDLAEITALLETTVQM